MQNFALRLLILCFILSNNIFSSDSKKNINLTKFSYTKRYSKFNINNVSTFIYNDGDADIRPDGNSGFEFPKGTNKAVIFESGFVWGGKVNGKILVGGSTYTQGLQPGKILDNGKAEDPNSEISRVFRVRPDYESADLNSEIEDEGKSESEIRFQYEQDWHEWPAEKGAPFWDKDKDGNYNPNIDIPGVRGADQTLWFVANDLDSNVAKSLYGSPTMGVELQVTVWGYKNVDVIENVVFKKYILINKSENKFEETYLSVWNDPDLGDAGDDFVGCDTTLSLGYVYNGDDDDATYGANPPSYGVKLLQGAIVPGDVDESAKFMGKIIKGMKNLQMTSFSFFIGGDPVYNDPDLGTYLTGTLQYYNLMIGRLGPTGNPFINPINNEEEIFTLSGDPITGEGWLDGILHPPGDRRILSNSGPFTMAAGDTQEVVIAQIAAGADENIDRLEAFSLLKLYTRQAQNFYDYDFQLTSPIEIYSPKTEIVALDDQIIISWYNDPNLNTIESFDQIGYKFQGYSVYQYPNNSYNQFEAKEIITFDLNDGIAKVISENTNFLDPSILFEIEKNGRDLGIQRHILIDSDLFNSDLPLNNGSEYFLGVSSYSYSHNNSAFIYPKIIESKPYHFSAVPEPPKPGNFYYGNYNDVIKVSKLSGNSQLDLIIKVVNPQKLTGGKYSIHFNVDPQLPDTGIQNIKFSLENDKGQVLIDNKKIIIQNNLMSVNPYVVDGFEIAPFQINNLMTANLQDGDQFIFETPNTILDSPELAKQQIKQINVFPNPYYAYHNNEVTQQGKYVTFNHLPQKAVIRIFNLAGQLVTSIKKNDETQFLRWNLTNKGGFYVPSGVFIAHIELPEIKQTKILKIAVILETVIPNYF